ncbi:hypothetical protein VLK31_24160 [Variovorax sp. H27-G14]|uniref:hypothetical protein n=1 Tax=Variovorax sp. H27-G14 TaxID=3111914 RepID=UPI0038FD1FC6
MPTPKPSQTTTREEPEPTQEESVPSDGRDMEGEAAMKKVRNHKLDEKGEGVAQASEPSKTQDNTGKPDAA